MQHKGRLRAIVVVAVLLAPAVWLVWKFPPYEICVRYYAKEAAPSTGSGARDYAEGLCDKKVRFWK